MQASPAAFLRTMTPYRADSVVAVECIVTWYWLADLCARAGSPVGLGHARYMNASHGGQAKHAQLDAHKIAVLRRGGMLPPAYGYAAERRATRDLLRRRLSLTRKRAELRGHVPHTNSPYNLPESGTKLADQANRPGVAARCPDSAGQKSMAVDLARMGYAAQLLRDLA